MLDGADGSDGNDGAPGPKGDPGLAATVNVGTTTTGAPGSDAEVTNTGTPSAAVFNFTIPRGDKGDKGEPGVGIQYKGTWDDKDNAPSPVVAGDLYAWVGASGVTLGTLLGVLSMVRLLTLVTVLLIQAIMIGLLSLLLIPKVLRKSLAVHLSLLITPTLLTNHWFQLQWLCQDWQ